MNLSHIVVGTDFSDASDQAVRVAAEWAAKLGAQVSLVHAVALPELDEGELAQPMPEDAELEAAVHGHLDRVRDRLLEGVEAKCVLLRSRSAADAITTFAQEAGADLIVVGTHGHTGLWHLLLGSVAEQVVRLSRCPVMTVRVGAEESVDG